VSNDPRQRLKIVGIGVEVAGVVDCSRVAGIVVFDRRVARKQRVPVWGTGISLNRLVKHGGGGRNFGTRQVAWRTMGCHD
jgi:hypothetical protein